MVADESRKWQIAGNRFFCEATDDYLLVRGGHWFGDCRMSGMGNAKRCGFLWSIVGQHVRLAFCAYVT